MASYKLEHLLQGVAAKRVKVVSKNDSMPSDIGEVWRAFIRYAKACMEQRRGLHLQSFCKVGWQLIRGQSRPRPFFQLTDQFLRAYAPNELRRQQIPSADRELCPFEDFNFSKAAIKFSNQLSKDQVFTGMKQIVQHLGEVICEGREIVIDFDGLGFLKCLNHEPSFVFGGAVYAEQGLSPPSPQAERRHHSGIASFSAQGPADAMKLAVRSSVPPLQDEDIAGSGQHFDADGGNSAVDQRLASPSLAASNSAPSLTRGASGSGTRTPLLTAQQLKREHAYKESLDRHIGEMEMRAEEVVREKEAWHSHVGGCLEQERHDIHEKRQRAQENQHFLKQQMNWGTRRRQVQRQEDISAASAHEFPKFTEPADSELKDFMKGQQARMRSDLDEQVRTKDTLRNLAKARERSLELSQIDANRAEMELLRDAERAKKAYDREALAVAWNSDVRLKNIWKAIDSHSKVGSQAPQILDCSLPPSTAGGRASSTVSAGRLMTGSQRRRPMGASSSLSSLEGRRG